MAQVVTLRDASAELSAAIDFGNLAAQQAPAGHPIFAALADAQDAKDSLESLIPWWSTGDGPALPRTSDQVAGVVAEIYSAAADLKVAPDQPLPKTLFSSSSAMPWGWIAAGALGLALSVYAWSRS